MRIKKRHLKRGLIALAIIIVIAIAYLLLQPKQETYGVDEQGFLHAPTHTDLKATRTLLLSDENVTVYKTTYQSYGATVYGNLYVPRGVDAAHKATAMLLLPGGGVTKEAEGKAARAFAHRGYAVLTIDQRGVGETGGPFRSLSDDFYAWKAGQIPTQHLLVLDALAGIQFLREQPETGKVLLAGESMGGRAAMVAARISSDIGGLIVISSSGYGDLALPPDQKMFFTSFNPDANLALVRVPVLFLHSTNDTTVPISYAQATFGRVNGPKKFLTVDGCAHGYCAAMEPLLDEGLPWLMR